MNSFPVLMSSSELHLPVDATVATVPRHQNGAEALTALELCVMLAAFVRHCLLLLSIPTDVS